MRACVRACARARACVCVCAKIQYYNYIICYFSGFNIYVIVGLVKRGFLTLVGETTDVQMTIIVTERLTDGQDDHDDSKAQFHHDDNFSSCCHRKQASVGENNNNNSYKALFSNQS